MKCIVAILSFMIGLVLSAQAFAYCPPTKPSTLQLQCEQAERLLQQQIQQQQEAQRRLIAQQQEAARLRQFQQQQLQLQQQVQAQRLQQEEAQRRLFAARHQDALHAVPVARGQQETPFQREASAQPRVTMRPTLLEQNGHSGADNKKTSEAPAVLRHYPQNVAKNCIRTRPGGQGNFGYGMEMLNTCTYPVQVVWCAITRDGNERCDRGFDSSEIIGAGKSWPVNALEGNQVAEVRFNACKGANGIQNGGVNNARMQVSCAAYPN